MKNFIKTSIILATLSFSTAFAGGDSDIKSTVTAIMKVLLVNPTVGDDGTSYDFRPAKEDVCSKIFGDPLENSNCTDQWANFRVNYTEFEDGSGKFKFYFGDLMPLSLTVNKAGEFGLKLYNQDIAAKAKEIITNLHAAQDTEGLTADELKQLQASNENDENIISLIPKAGVELISFIKGDKSHEIKIEVIEAFALNKNFGDAETPNNLTIQLGVGSVISAKIDQLNLKSFAKLDLRNALIRVPDLISPYSVPTHYVDEKGNDAIKNVPASIKLEGTQIAATLNLNNDIKTFQLSDFAINALTLKLADHLFATVSTNGTTGSVKLAQTETGMRLDLQNAFHLSAIIDDSILNTGIAPSGTYFFKNGAGSFASIDTDYGINASLLSHIPNPNFFTGEDGKPYRYEISLDDGQTIVASEYTPTTQTISLRLKGLEVGAPVMNGVHGSLSDLSATIYGLNTTNKGLGSMAAAFNLGTGYVKIGEKNLIAFNQNKQAWFEAGMNYSDNKLTQMIYLSAFDLGLNFEDGLYKGLLTQFTKPEEVDPILNQFGLANLQSVNIEVQADTLLNTNQGFTSGGVTITNTVDSTTTVLFPFPAGDGGGGSSSSSSESSSDSSSSDGGAPAG